MTWDELKEIKDALQNSEMGNINFNKEHREKVFERLNRVSKEIQSTRTSKWAIIKQRTKPVLTFVLSTCLIALFFAGIITIVLNSDSGETNANHTERKVENDTVPPNKDEEDNIPEVENESSNDEKETIDSSIKQVEESPVTEQTNEVNSNYFDQEFISLAEQGYIKGLPIQVGTTVGEIKAKYGEPLEYGAAEGAFSLIYEDYCFYYDATVPYEERANVKDDVLTVPALKIKEQLYLSDIKKGLGEPDYDWYSENIEKTEYPEDLEKIKNRGFFTITYIFGDYFLSVDIELSEESRIKTLRLSQR